MYAQYSVLDVQTNGGEVWCITQFHYLPQNWGFVGRGWEGIGKILSRSYRAVPNFLYIDK